ncbi:MAG: bifunctional metallophosphatase/5'-nucleotidase [Flavobacteriales bacterium]
MKRRAFLKTSILGTGALVFLSSFRLKKAHQALKEKKLVILHTNDTHSQIEPFPANHPKYPNKGGVAKRAQLIDDIRQQEEHVLLLDSGDIFQGTPYFNLFHGELEMKLMSAMKYDAATMGNHDFDIGLEGFLNAKKQADFPFLCANYDFSNTILKDETKAYHIFHKAGLKIGVFGIGVELAGLVPKEKYGETRYLDPIKTANQTAKTLRQKGCDLIICLSHLGYSYPDSTKPSDLRLAKENDYIDLILGGHTHTFMEKPENYLNQTGKNTTIHQVGFGGIYLGRIELSSTHLSCWKHRIE